MQVTIIKTPVGCFAGDAGKLKRTPKGSPELRNPLDEIAEERSQEITLYNPIMFEVISSPVLSKTTQQVIGINWSWTVVKLYTDQIQLSLNSGSFALWTVDTETDNPLAKLYSDFAKQKLPGGLAH